MKIALILSGQIRCFEKCFPTHKKFLLDVLKCDVFCHFWDTADLKPNIRAAVSQDRIPDYIHIKNDSLLKERILDSYRPKNYIIEPQIQFNGLLFNFRIVSMFYSMMKSYELCREYGNYDCIIRARTDLFFKQPIVEEWFDCLDFIYCNRFESNSCCDMFAIGSSDLMDTYFDCYNYIKDNKFKGNDYGPERLLTEVLKVNSIPIKYIDEWHQIHSFFCLER